MAVTRLTLTSTQQAPCRSSKAVSLSSHVHTRTRAHKCVTCHVLFLQSLFFLAGEAAERTIPSQLLANGAWGSNFSNVFSATLAFSPNVQSQRCQALRQSSRRGVLCDIPHMLRKATHHIHVRSYDLTHVGSISILHLSLVSTPP